MNSRGISPATAWRPLAVVIVLLALVPRAAFAADVVKANNVDALNLTTSWSGGVLPTASDVAVWNSAVTAANAVSLGANTTWGGVRVENPGGTVTLQGAFTLSAGAVTVNSGGSLVLNNGTSTLNAASLNGAGTLTISKAASSTTLSGMTAANSLNLTGSLLLRGGAASTSAGTMQSTWLAMGGTGVSQAAGTAFALDTGASTTDAKDIIFTDVWSGKTVAVSSLTGFGSIRRDGGVTNNMTLRVEQSTNTTFNGLVLSHTSGGGAIRSIDFVKAGTGTLTLAGLVGKQTASAGAATSPVNVEVAGGTLAMTADNTTTGSLTIRSGGLLRMENGSAGTNFTGGNASMTGSYTVDAGGEIQAFRNGAAAFGTGPIVLNGGSLFQTSGNWTWTNPITLNASTAATVGNKGTGTNRWLKLQGVIGGSGDVTFSDPTGAMTNGDTGIILTGTNTLSGAVTVNTFVRVGGVTGDSTSLVAGPGGSLGTAAVTVNSARRLTFSRSDTHTVANTIGGTGAVFIGSTGISGSSTQDVTLSGSNNYSGGTELLQGTLRVAALSGIGTGYLAVKNGSTFAYTGAGSETTTRNLFLDLGASRIDVTEAAGSLAWTDASAKTGAFTKGGAGSLTLGGVISSTASVTVAAGRLTLTGTNTYTGTTTISAGTLALGDGGTTGAIADASAVDIASGATLLWNRSNSDTAFANAISGAGTFAKTGAGEVGLTGTNTFSGLLDIQEGKIGLSSAGSVNGAPSVTIAAGGTLSIGSGFSNSAATIGSLTGAGLVDTAFGGSNDTRTLSINQTTSGTFSGTLTNAANARVLAITKAGAGSLTLAAGGTYGYTGATAITGGTLLVNGDLTGTSGVSVSSGATLGGAGTIGGPVSILGGGLVAPGTSPGTLTVGNTFTLADTSILAFELSPTDNTVGGGINDLVTGVTNLTLDGVLNVSGAGDWTTAADNTAWRLFNYSGTLTDNTLALGTMPFPGSGRSFVIDTATTGQVNLVVVPEPGTMLIGAAVVGLVCWSLRRR